MVFCFGFLAAGSLSEFLLTSGVLENIKGSLYQPHFFLEKLEFLKFLFWSNDSENFKAFSSPCM